MSRTVLPCAKISKDRLLAAHPVSVIWAGTAKPHGSTGRSHKSNSRRRGNHGLSAHARHAIRRNTATCRPRPGTQGARQIWVICGPHTPALSRFARVPIRSVAYQGSGVGRQRSRCVAGEPCPVSCCADRRSRLAGRVRPPGTPGASVAATASLTEPVVIGCAVVRFRVWWPRAVAGCRELGCDSGRGYGPAGRCFRRALASGGTRAGGRVGGAWGVMLAAWLRRCRSVRWAEVRRSEVLFDFSAPSRIRTCAHGSGVQSRM
jgi:hypothetical protein